IRLKNRVLLAEELELLGRMSRGMAHDLNNLLTPVSTFLQLSADRARTSDPPVDLMNSALRNVHTIQAYIREALFFSQTHTPHFQTGRLDAVVNKAVSFAESRLQEKRIGVTISAPPETAIEMDEVLVQRMISN